MTPAVHATLFAQLVEFGPNRRAASSATQCAGQDRGVAAPLTISSAGDTHLSMAEIMRRVCERCRSSRLRVVHPAARRLHSEGDME